MPHDLSLRYLIPIYLDALEAEGKSPKTITAYRESLQMYLRIADPEGLPHDAGEITPPDVYRYLAAVRRRGVCDATQHRRHREMKHFFSWLKRMDLVPENPFQKVPLIRLEQKIVQPFSLEDVRRMLDPHRFRHTFATIAIRSAAREIDVQHLLGHSTSAMVRRYTRTYDAEQAAVAHASFSPAAQLLD